MPSESVMLSCRRCCRYRQADRRGEIGRATPDARQSRCRGGQLGARLQRSFLAGARRVGRRHRRGQALRVGKRGRGRLVSDMRPTSVPALPGVPLALIPGMPLLVEGIGQSQALAPDPELDPATGLATSPDTGLVVGVYKVGALFPPLSPPPLLPAALAAPAAIAATVAHGILQRYLVPRQCHRLAAETPGERPEVDASVGIQPERALGTLLLGPD